MTTTYTNLLKRLQRKPTETQQQTPLEQTKNLIEQAERFDRLTREPGWEEILKFMAANVQDEIAQATQHQYEAELSRIHCVRWNAKRSLLDSAVGYIESVQRSRDEIVEQYRKGEADGGTGSPAGN